MRTARVLGLMATLALIAASMSMNGIFLYSQGKTPGEAWVFVVLSIAADCFKAILPILIAEAWVNGSRVKATAGGMLLAVLVTFSFGSSLGYAALNRGFQAESRNHATGELRDLERQVARIDADLARLGEVRPSAVIARELAALRVERAWEQSKACSDVTLRETREFCRGYRSTEADLDKARAAEEMAFRRGQLRERMAQLVAAGAGQESDALAGYIARVLGLSSAMMRDLLIVGVALVVELGSAFGLFLVGYDPREPRSPGPAEQPPKPASPRPLSRRIGTAPLSSRVDSSKVH
jgi:hypothetical protein